LPNAISPATPEFRSKSSQNFLAYLLDRPQNLFNDFASKFRSFVNESAFGNRPYRIRKPIKSKIPRFESGVIFDLELPREASSTTAAAHRGPGVCFAPAILAVDVTSGSGRKRNRVRSAALGTGDIVARTVVLPTAAASTLILKGHENELVGMML